jgi:hypothetical protein
MCASDVAGVAAINKRLKDWTAPDCGEMCEVWSVVGFKVVDDFQNCGSLKRGVVPTGVVQRICED